MKKVFKPLSVFLLSAAVALSSCEGPVGPQGDQGSQGAQGPQGIAGPTGPAGADGATGPEGAAGADGTDGTDGTDGKDGNANVTSKEVTVNPTDWQRVQIAGIGTNTSSTWGGVLIEDPEITTDKTVQAFLKLGSKWQALPIEFIKDGDGSKEYMSFGYQTGSVQFNYRQISIDGLTRTYAPTSAVTLKYITIQQTLGQAMENAGVNMRNYNEVVDYINAHGGQL